MFNIERKLIEAVRVRRVMYDPSHEDYLKNRVKTKKWEEVAEEVGLRSGADAKEMWMKLRHSLRDAIRRRQKFLKSGVPANALKPWKFQKLMGFLLPYMANKPEEMNVNEDTDERETPSQNCDNDSPADVVGEREESLSVQQGVRSARDEAQPRVLPEISTQKEEQTPAKKMKTDLLARLLKENMKKHKERRKRSMEQHKERRNWSMEQYKERRKSRSEVRKRKLEQTGAPSHSLYHFFMSMYEATKNMPPASQFVVRNDIFRVVTDMEASLLNIPTISEYDADAWSYNELSHYNNQIANQSYISSSSPAYSSHSDSSFRNPKENCGFEQND